MDTLLNQIRKTPEKPEELLKLNKKLYEQDKTIKKYLGQIPQVLDNLQLPVHTLGYVHLLAARAGTEIKNHNEFVDQARPLLQQGDAEAFLLAKDKLAAVCRQFATSILMTDFPMRGINPLRKAVRIISMENPNLLTSIHADFAKVCLKTKMYAAAIPVIEQPYFQMKAKETGMEVLDYLLYHHYAGLLFLGVKKHAKALESFQLVLTTPSSSLSAIQVESFKRYVICGLIVHGELLQLNGKTTSSAVSRNIERVCSSYIDFARAYKKSVDSAQKVIEEKAEDFSKDKTIGLLKQAQQALMKRNILRLTNTYVTLSLTDLTKMANLRSTGQAELYLLRMIEEGTLFAKINQKDGMVSFLEDPEEYDTTAMIEKLDSKIKEAVELSRKLKEVDRQITLDPNYIKKTTPLGDGDQLGGGSAREDLEMKRVLEMSLH